MSFISISIILGSNQSFTDLLRRANVEFGFVYGKKYSWGEFKFLKKS